MQITTQDQAGNRLTKIVERWVILLERRSEVRVVVGFLVDRLEQVETVQQKVATTTGRIKDLEITRVFL
jgi:chemotaxis signal transduction protein